MLAYLWMFIIGIVVGAIARLIMPGAQQMGLLLTGVFGVGGAFLGGFISRSYTGSTGVDPLDAPGIIMSVIGALILLFAYGKLKG